MNLINKILPAEWAHQSGVMLTWPHIDTDWAEMLQEVELCFAEIAKTILRFEKLLVVCQSRQQVEKYIPVQLRENLRIAEIDSNDTWARDHGPITVFIDDIPTLLDFKFNGWGLKFAANKDNLITRRLYQQNFFNNQVEYQNQLGFVFEGGSIESDGQGTFLTTTECLLSLNRNGDLTKEEIEQILKEKMGAEHILWLNNGYLAGDDTDSHIDTLARLCNENTIAYVKCDDRNDEHFISLKAMEAELQQMKKSDGSSYNLVALPMAEEVYFDDHRIPATYANFLIINGAVLVPAYGSHKDLLAKQILQDIFSDREIILIDCLPLIKQHGSLHCVTMQFPEGVLN